MSGSLISASDVAKVQWWRSTEIVCLLMKTHCPATPLYPPWGKQILRDPYEFTVKPHFPAPPLHPPWGKQILRDPCKFTVKPNFPPPPLHPLWEMQTVHFIIRLHRKPTFSSTSYAPPLGDANCAFHNTTPYETDIFHHLLCTPSWRCKLCIS